MSFEVARVDDVPPFDLGFATGLQAHGFLGFIVLLCADLDDTSWPDHHCRRNPRVATMIVVPASALEQHKAIRIVLIQHLYCWKKKLFMHSNLICKLI